MIINFMFINIRKILPDTLLKGERRSGQLLLSFILRTGSKAGEALYWKLNTGILSELFFIM